jgi:hypothetical protein
MRRAFCLCLGFLCIFILATPKVVEFKNYYTGDAAQLYSPPPGCVLYIIPDISNTGTITERIRGRNETTISIVIGEDNKISWNSNFPVRAIIVQSTKGYYLYEYNQATLNGEFVPSDVDDLKYVAVVYGEPESTLGETLAPTGSTQTPGTSVVPSPTDDIPITADSRIGFIYTGVILLLGATICAAVLGFVKNRTK